MADQSVKIIEGERGADVQAKVDAWIETLNAGYDILEMTLCQAGSSLQSEKVVLAIKFTDGT